MVMILVATHLGGEWFGSNLERRRGVRVSYSYEEDSDAAATLSHFDPMAGSPSVMSSFIVSGGLSIL